MGGELLADETDLFDVLLPAGQDEVQSRRRHPRMLVFLAVLHRQHRLAVVQPQPEVRLRRQQHVDLLGLQQVAVVLVQPLNVQLAFAEGHQVDALGLLHVERHELAVVDQQGIVIAGVAVMGQGGGAEQAVRPGAADERRGRQPRRRRERRQPGGGRGALARLGQRCGAGQAWNRPVGTGREGEPGDGGPHLLRGGRPRREVADGAGAADDADGDLAVHEAGGELEDGDAEDGVQQQRQPGHHEQGAAIPQLIAQLAEPDDANDRPAHTSPFKVVGGRP